MVTSDGMSCRKAIVDKIKEYGADYLISLKGNQSGFYDQVVSLFERGEDMYPGKIAKQSFVSDWKKVGGRVERRIITVVPVDGFALEWLARAPEWTGIKSVLRVERELQVVGGVKKGQTSPGTSATSCPACRSRRKPCWASWSPAGRRKSRATCWTRRSEMTSAGSGEGMGR